MNKARFINILLIVAGLMPGHLSAQGNPNGRYSVVISEVMADPTPVVELPVAEYVELHNRGDARTLTGWKIQFGNTLKELPSIPMDSGGYAVIVAQKNLMAMQNVCPNVYALSSLSITDGGQSITLFDDRGRIIHFLSFRKDWHLEPIKREGGWSLEMMDDALPSAGVGNWASSVDESGGTPGRANSIRQTIGDVDPPHITRITLLDSLTLRVFFNETLYFEDTIYNNVFTVNSDLPIRKISEVPPNFSALDVQLSQMPSLTRRYSMVIHGLLQDFSGNIAQVGESISFGVPMKPCFGSLIINEILTHPFEGLDADFIEVFNNSDQILDLKEVRIGSGGDTLPQKAVFITDGRQLFPGEYCAVCKNKTLTSGQYFCPDMLTLLECDSLPAFANANGVVYLTTRGLTLLDKLVYEEKMHYSGLSSTEGVSLERIHPNRATNDPDNWHSAASSVGFATPGYRNSQDGIVDERDGITLTTEVFSPDNDGFQDYTEFQCRFRELQNRLKIEIFDAHGKLVRHLVNNEPCGGEASYRWDGEDDQGTRLPSGMYVAICRWWNIESGRTGYLRRIVSIYLP